MAIVLPTPALANTASEENGGSRIASVSGKGKMRLVWSALLCSDAAAADANCTPFDLGGNLGQGGTVVIHLFDDGFGFSCTDGVCVQQSGGSEDCSAVPTVTLTTAPWRNAANDLSPTSARAIATDSVLTDASAVDRVITLNTEDTPLDRYLFATLTNMTGCDDLDVAIYVYDEL